MRCGWSRARFQRGCDDADQDDRRARPDGRASADAGSYEDAWILTSETCALDIIGANFVREIEPGEMVIITEDGVRVRGRFDEAESRASACSSMSTSHARTA